MIDTWQDIGRNSGRQMRAAGAGRLGGGGGVLGGGGPHGTNDDFWLPKVRNFAAMIWSWILWRWPVLALGVWGNWPGKKRGSTAVPQRGEKWAFSVACTLMSCTTQLIMMFTFPQIEGVSSQLDAREGSRRNLPHVWSKLASLACLAEKLKTLYFLLNCYSFER